jgi:hypothetical protein
MTLFCKDCRHFDVGSTRCLASSNINLVTGEHAHFHASVERGGTDAESCGLKARHFQARVVVPQTEETF